MNNKKLTLLGVLFLLLALVGWSSWIYEIDVVIGWNSLEWLDRPLYSVFVATFFSTLAFVVPFLVVRNFQITPAILWFSVWLYGGSLTSFYAGKNLCFEVYQSSFYDKLQVYYYLIVTGGLFIGFGGYVWWFTHRFLFRNPAFNSLLLAFAASMSIPLSLITVRICPGFGSSSGWVDAVKMGYPIFWTILLMGCSGMWIAQKAGKEYR